MNITLEQRNAQKLYNLLNVANENVQNRDVYYYLKYYVKTMINQYKLYPKDQEILLGHITAISNELSSSQWDINQFDPKKYDLFLNEFYKKVDFRKIDTEFMFKCKDILDVSPVKNDLYRRRMEFFNKKLPKITPGNLLLKTQMQNNNLNTNNFNNNFNNNINNNNNINLNQVSDKPINPFASINNQASNPYENSYGYGNNNSPYGNMGQSPYQENNFNNNNNNGRNILRGQRPGNGNNNMNNINNANNMNNAMNMNNIENKKKLIPEDIKQKIINELKMVSDEIQNGKIDNCKKHSVEALILFKQIFPEE